MTYFIGNSDSVLSVRARAYRVWSWYVFSLWSDDTDMFMTDLIFYYCWLIVVFVGFWGFFVCFFTSLNQQLFSNVCLSWRLYYTLISMVSQVQTQFSHMSIYRCCRPVMLPFYFFWITVIYSVYQFCFRDYICCFVSALLILI